MKQRIEELKKKLRIAEQNYNDTRADAYLVEQHQLKEEIATLESMVTPAPVSDDSQAQEPAAAPTQSEFQTPTNVEELPSAISRYIVATQGDLAGSMTDKEIASRQRELLGTAREFYEEQNDTDALERVDAMIEKVEAIISADSENGTDNDDETDGEGSQNDDENEGAEGDNDNPEEEEEEKTPTEATETAPAAPQTPKPTKGTAREFYEEQNDTDALERVDAMIEKVEVIISADSENGTDNDDETDGEGGQNDDENEGAEGDNSNSEEEEEEKTPTEATETAPAAPQTPKPTKTTPAKKKPTSGKKNGSKSKSKKK